MLLAYLVGQVFECSLDTTRTRHQFRQINPALDSVFAKASAQHLLRSLTVSARNVAARKGFEADAGRRYPCSVPRFIFVPDLQTGGKSVVNGSHLFETPLSDAIAPGVLLQYTASIRQAITKDSVQTTQSVVPELRKQDESLRKSAVNPRKVVSMSTKIDSHICHVLTKSVCP